MPRYQRKYYCQDCGHKWALVYDIALRDEQGSIIEPECPKCSNQPPVVPARIAAPSIIGTKSKAIDKAWEIAQEDFGLTNMRDGAKEGDTAFIAPPAPPSNIDPRTIQRPGFMWGGAQGGNLVPSGPQLLSGARLASAVAKSENRNPMTMLHRKRPKLVAQPLNKGG